MKITIIGSGYVGLVTACCLADAGHHVTCIDHDTSKTTALAAGHLPFHEPELDELLRRGLDHGRLSFHHRICTLTVSHADLVLLAVGTPADQQGTVNLDSLLASAAALGDCVNRPSMVVIKSTVPPGTGERIEVMLNASGRRTQDCGPGFPDDYVHVVSNPEFLAEGHAVRDFLHPERIVIGTSDAHCRQIMSDLYAPFSENGSRLLFMDRRSAEFAKYACNAMLAARISLINELAALADSQRACIAEICRVLKTDPRIGPDYLDPGIGYGGSCLPKDLQALITMARASGQPADMLCSTQRVNTRQVPLLLDTMRACLGGLTGRRIAVWGLSFKPGTDDVRAAPSLALVRGLIGAGARVAAYDPVATASARRALGNIPVYFGMSAFEVCHDAHALVVMTEWDEFRQCDMAALAHVMPGGAVFDARRIYDPATLGGYGLRHIRPHQPRTATTTEDTISSRSGGAQNTEMYVQGHPETRHAAATADGGGPASYPAAVTSGRRPAKA